MTVRLRIEEDNRSFENIVQSGCGLGECYGGWGAKLEPNMRNFQEIEVSRKMLQKQNADC